MVKVAHRKENTILHQVSNDISFLDYDDSIASTDTSEINPTVNAEDVTTFNDIENQDYIQQSNVWKFASKIGSEKARCNICQTGEHLEEIIHNFELS